MPKHDKPRGQSSGVIRLGLCVCLIVAVWLIALPWLATQPKMNARLQWLDERGIDPSAMFYTDLDAMDPILERLECRRRIGP